jgi:hypothetical protein
MWFRSKSFILGSAILCSGCAGTPAAAPPAPRSAQGTPAAAERESPESAPVRRGPAPTPASPVAAAPATPAATRANVHGGTLAEAMDRFLALEHARGASAEHVTELIDLNGDRHQDALVLMRSRRYCGSRGCLLLVFEGTGKGYRLNSRLLLGRTPMIATDARTEGWRDLVAPMTTARAGMRLVVLKHGAAGYPADAEQLAVVPPTRSVQGRVLFSDD